MPQAERMVVLLIVEQLRRVRVWKTSSGMACWVRTYDMSVRTQGRQLGEESELKRKMWESKAGGKRRKWGVRPKSFKNPCSWGVKIKLDGVRSRKKTRRKWHQKSRCERVSRRLEVTREAPSGDSAAALPGPIMLRGKLMLLWLDYELIGGEGEFTLTLGKPMFT